jgi:hypothetical protein
MILIIRGHIRNAFDDDKLYNFINDIYDSNKDLQIYIHTWNIYANNISWRPIEVNNNVVTNDIIYTYFRDLKCIIKHIIIENDKQINLIGNLEGNICYGPMPIIGWKNYWYSKFRIIEYIKSVSDNNNDMVVNMRFDLLNNSNNFAEDELLKFINNISKNPILRSRIRKNYFLHNYEFNGMDNIYMGNVDTMFKLSSMFHYDLDSILDSNKDIYIIKKGWYTE